MLSLIKDVLANLLCLFFLFESITSGFEGDFNKGCYFMLWLIVFINIVLLMEDENELQ